MPRTEAEAELSGIRECRDVLAKEARDLFRTTHWCPRCCGRSEDPYRCTYCGEKREAK